MFLTILDLILILILFLFIAFGFALGFIHTLGALVGVVIGGWIAANYYSPLSSWLSPILLGQQTTAEIISFILLFTIVNRGVGIVFWLIGKIFHLVSIIPFTKMINRLLGAFLGLVEGTLALGLILIFISQATGSDWLSHVINGSQVAGWLMVIAGVLMPLLPEIARQVKEAI
ncbi:MAG: hypothetical protein A2729_02745 [Candidatus Buchananbacteria bacterium RIFCSPHIGHO2_01_FULL_39_14]|uniref:Colicin V production protein n=2 Tax=Candidatus Buchananiibacteriota TaxID=1817903 RepID=A0A1G1YTD8_9BACT|nr:MAG: hypothetical protein A2729_02745 [Candidatus Buchananbacteria bacterium RIFCSPHIGHO2_01_FULL_39_14]OGY49455.1 MAG: hypothetical protein A3D39_02870 [Candidatus Buchananbacteria bacterium RIFCSPHIGHO2_02_FULL_39_17]OGY55622.1 MAG: hypothetical protein A2912_05435 [Candidatus Buchananbacteria bacterium RIFCSPLOWO2_01_FULL_40_23b]